MIARIKFVSQNELNSQQLKELQEFLGESVRAEQMKIEYDGSIVPTSWRDTFSREKVEQDSDYNLVTPADRFRISDDSSYLVDFQQFSTKFPQLEVTVRGIPRALGSYHLDFIQEMQKVAQKIDEAKNRFDSVVEFNQKCNVHVPNLGLLNINRLAYYEDACTERLQDKLVQGWRILAICPQPDQRRPDYILGMHVIEKEDSVDVVRFAD